MQTLEDLEDDETPEVADITETPHTFQLKAPVDGVDEITLREMTLDEIAKYNDYREKHGPIRALKFAISQVSGVEPATVGKLGSRDFNTCSKYLTAFFE